MPLDPRIALGIQQYQAPNMLEMAQNAMAIRNAQQTNQLNQMRMAQAQQEEADNMLLRQAYNTPDPVNFLTQQGRGDLVPGVQKQQYESQSAKMKQSGDIQDFISKGLMHITNDPSDQNIVNWANQAAGILPPDVVNESLQQLLAVPAEKRADYIRSLNMTPKEQFTLTEPNWVERSDNQKKWYEDTNPRSTTFGQKKSEITMKATPGQELTYSLGQDRLAKSGVSQAQYPLVAKAIAEGKAPPSVNSRTAALYEQALQLNPDADLASSYARSKLLSNSVFQNRGLAAQALPEQLNLVAEAGKKLNFSPNLKVTADIQKFYKEHTQDPDMTDYMSKRNDLIQSLAFVMRNTGMTEGAVKLEAEALSPTMSPAMLDRWVKSQMEMLQPRLKQFQAISPISNVGTPPATPPPPAGANIPQTAIDHLKSNPALRTQFDAKYGAGSAAKILGK